MNYKISIFLCFFSISLFAQTGFKKEITYNKDRKLETAIWYPSLEKENETFAQNILFYGFKSKANAQIKKGKYPLIVFVHGSTGNVKNQSWLANDLAKNNIVIAANHPGYTSKNSNPESLLRVWNQPKDVSYLIDYALKSEFKNYIDENKIYVLGFSLGGYTSLALSGAKLDMSKYEEFCKKYEDEACKYFKEVFSIINKQYLKNASQDLKDKRIKASIALAPGFVQNMTNESLRKIDIPTLIIGAQLDYSVPVETAIKSKMQHFSKTIKYYEIKDAGHFSFLQRCTSKAPFILEEENAQFICLDGKKKKRETIHQETTKLVKSFLKEVNNLK